VSFRGIFARGAMTHGCSRVGRGSTSRVPRVLPEERFRVVISLSRKRVIAPAGGPGVPDATQGQFSTTVANRSTAAVSISLGKPA
jgi:hypothetical protein